MFMFRSSPAFQRMISSQLELHRLNTGTQPRVVTAVTRLKQRLFQYAFRPELILLLFSSVRNVILL
jgi:hypothetical protein